MIEEALAKKIKAEGEILAILTALERETGLTVDEIRLLRPPVTADHLVGSYLVRVKLVLKLDQWRTIP